MPERTVIQWDKDDLDALGMLKIDVLALGMLTRISKSFALLSRHKGESLSLATTCRPRIRPSTTCSAGRTRSASSRSRAARR